MLYDTADGSFEVKAREYLGNCEDVALHDAENVYRNVMRLGREVSLGKKVEMIALGVTWHSLLLCDKNMRSATPVYLWSYTGAAGLCRELRSDPEYVKHFYHKTGCMVNAIYPYFKLMHLRKTGYDLKNYYIMGQGTYNCYRMTGKRVITPCMASGTGLLNIHTRQFDRELLEELGIAEEQLSELVDYRQTFPLTGEAAKLLGVEPGIPVIPANSDGGLNQVGVGAMEEGVMTFSVGTSGAIRLTTDRPIIPEQPGTWCYLSPKAWLSGAATNGCCNCIDWFKKGVYGSKVSYEEIERGISDRETTPVFLPFLYGERCPGWDDERTGGFLGVQPWHGPGDLYRAVQEGVLFNLYQCYKMLSGLHGVPKKIKFSGGILHSEEWTQMCADIFQAELEVDGNEHGSLLGGAILAMELAGILEDVRDFRPKPVRVVLPDREKACFYEQKYERYLDCYHRMNRPL